MSQWREAFEARARDHWTPARLQQLLQGKALLVTPANAPCLLRSMGILDAHAQLQPTRVRKFRQINHLLRFLEPALAQLGPGPLSFIDAGCGRSALGFLLAWWFDGRARILGIDRSSEVIDGCRERAEQTGLPLAFAVADLDDADLDGLWTAAWGDPLVLDGLLAPHACDTATDAALALGIHREATFVAVAPCCQAELARAWEPLDQLGVLQHNPHFRRTLAATVTDAMRVELLGAAGYDVRAVEFVEAHHTPKNTLIYGHRTGRPGSRAGYDALVSQTGGQGIALAGLLGARYELHSTHSPGGG